jgi:hypothetical protein
MQELLVQTMVMSTAVVRTGWSLFLLFYHFLFRELIACCPNGSFYLLTLLQHAMHHGEG